MTYRIAVLVPSRGRPHNIERLHSAIHDTAADPDRVFLAVRVDEDDPAVDGYRRLSEAYRHDPTIGWGYGPRVKLAASWNEQARVLTSPGWPDGGRPFTHLALWGDDVIPETEGWDKILTDRTRADGPGIVYGRDGIWDHHPWPDHPDHLVLPTACVMSVEVYRALGWVSAPGLVHLNIDLAWRDAGYEAGALFYEPDVLIRHLHRIAGAPDDQTYRDANDDTAQKSHDHSTYTAWRHSDDYRAAVDRLAAMRERWHLGQTAKVASS